MISIRNEIELLKNLEIAEPNFGLVSYIDSQNQIRLCYILNDEGMLQILNKGSAIVRCKTIKLIKELKEEKCKITITIAKSKTSIITSRTTSITTIL